MFRTDPRKTHFAPSSASTVSTAPTGYPHRLNFYTVPPTSEITLDQFEQWALNRLKVLGEIESCQYRNKTAKETEAILKPLLDKYLPLSTSTSAGFSTAKLAKVTEERKKDHYSHFILRLTFARSDELRARFSRAERVLFRIRWATDDAVERQRFLGSLNLNWDPIDADELQNLSPYLSSLSGPTAANETYFKVDWERVPDLVEQRRVFLRAGKAYVPTSEQLSLVSAEFTSRLDAALELTARSLPRLDEDDRIIPILNHLSLDFTQPEYNTPANLTGAAITAKSIDGLVNPHFPLCMSHLHNTLKRTHHLKHFGRLQYTLFLKGIGLSPDEAITFWRTSFSTITDDKFTKDYRYNIRHAYGLEGNRRNYKPLSCQQILIDRPPGPGETHGCPYRHFSVDNLVAALSRGGIVDKNVLGGVREDVEKKKFHLACNRVFEHVHARELKREKDEGRAVNETIVHPNVYFARSWELRNPGVRARGAGAVEEEQGGQGGHGEE
ncbi:eukaryotic and archaeal DNA primase, large subunit-domain-containing protein [Terfezia claveryi]|nr:eukaryotic and archaeal DNA primase, large subunit-domain-containing protein [Terfezia claveryi]